MIHPAAFDDDPPSRIAIHVAYTHFRLQLWRDVRLLRRVTLAVMDAFACGTDPEQAAWHEAAEVCDGQ